MACAGSRAAGTLIGALSEPLLSLRGVAHRFGERTALAGIELQIGPGEVVGLLGPNGAGKTTLLRICCGVLAPTAGHVRVAGVDPARSPREAARHFGYVPQRGGLYDDLSVDENLEFFAALQGFRGREREECIARALEAVLLADRRRDTVSSLSGGLRQRLSLAVALLHRPAVLFLDEPTVGLDPRVRRQIWQVFDRLAAGGTAIVVSTHQMDEASYCRRLVLLWEGRVLQDAPAKRFGAGPVLERHFLRLIEQAAA